jgi:flagellar protein FliS
MFGSNTPGASAYAKVDIDTGVLAASPHKLTMMLFDAALLALTMAHMHMKAGDIEKKGKSISRAIMMIDSGLRASLDKKASGAIADNLDALYLYMSGRLLTANLKNQPELIDEVYALLKDLRSTWESIGPDVSAQVAAQVIAPATAPIHTAATTTAAPKSSAYGSLAPRSSGFVYG